MATGNMYFLKFVRGFCDMQVNRHTDRQTDRHADHAHHNTLHPYRG